MVTRDAFYSDTAPSGDPQYIGAPQPYGYSPTDARQLDLQQASYAVVAAEYDASVQPQLLSTFGDQFDQRPGSSIPHLPDQTAYNLADVSPPGQPSLPVYSDDHEMSMVQQDSAAYWSSRSQFNGEFDTFRSTLRSDDLKLAGQQIMAISEWFLPRALQMGKCRE